MEPDPHALLLMKALTRRLQQLHLQKPGLSSCSQMEPFRMVGSQLGRGLKAQSSMILLCSLEGPMTSSRPRVTVSKGFRQGKSRPAGEALSRVRGRSGGLPAGRFWLPGPAVPRGNSPARVSHRRRWTRLAPQEVREEPVQCASSFCPLMHVGIAGLQSWSHHQAVSSLALLQCSEADRSCMV